MSVKTYASLNGLAKSVRNTLGPEDSLKKYVLLYAYNGTGKTRLSVEFKDMGKRKLRGAAGEPRDTLYYNAFTEDLFTWNNDLEGDTDRRLLFNRTSHFFDGLGELDLDSCVRKFLRPHADFDFTIHYDDGYIDFSRTVPGRRGTETAMGIKISRGEENLFIWCFFLAVAEQALLGADSYKWVKYLYIDDPISSLDDNNVVAMACQLAGLLREGNVKTVISTHHALFFNVMSNELRGREMERRFLSFQKESGTYVLRNTTDTPFFHHIVLLKELKTAADSGRLYTYHFNILRNILEKTASFHGYDHFSACIKRESGDLDGAIFARMVNLLSHGNYSLFDPIEMVEDNKNIFRKILSGFLETYPFNPDLFQDE